MPRIAYENRRFSGPVLRTIQAADQICTEYAAAGYDITLRQLYYQFVARGLIPNSDREYKRLGDIVNNARLTGYMDWNHIVDRTRRPAPPYDGGTPAEFLRNMAEGYSRDLWADQPYHLEVWVEKEALAGIVSGVCVDEGVTSFACRGYVSQSAQWRAARRMAEMVRAGKNVVVLHLGDHDPSGIDMTRDNVDRLEKFVVTDIYQSQEGDEAFGASYRDIWNHVREKYGAEPLRIERLALNMDQIEEYEPPPNPAKLTDSRARDYVDLYGYESWELDALPPDVLADLIRNAVAGYRDDALYLAAQDRQEEGRETLVRMAETLEAESD